ncbi:FUSC family protein [Actinomyces sp. zg-332]|uniref:FUSC family protein n=1 Tax=Actinomyces sp. zg-332 TaxID=2708340 RepID=UPI0014205185|nr:FUSC family protein [Actinomyces sp. zg-332]QPK94215.1 FUSC family protein [Actinomyces sp. zg-332]
MSYLPPDPLEKDSQSQVRHDIFYRVLRRLRMVDPGLITTKLFFTSLLLTSILYAVPITIFLLNGIPLKFTFLSAGAYVFLQIPIFYRYKKKDVATGWLTAIPVVIIVSLIAYSFYQYKYLTIVLYILCMCMPVILPKYFVSKGRVIGVSMMNAYLNSMLNGPILDKNPQYLYVIYACSITSVLIVALVSYIIVSDPMTKVVAVRKSLGAIAQGFSQLYANSELPIDIKIKKAKKLSSHFHNCAISIDAVLQAAPEIPRDLAQSYHRSVFDEDQVISALADSIDEDLTYFEERYYWNEFCKCRVMQNEIAKKIDECILEKQNEKKIRNVGNIREYFSKLSRKSKQQNIVTQNTEEAFNINVNYSDLKATPTMTIADIAAKTNNFSKLSMDLRTRNFMQGLIAITLSSVVGYMINDRYFYFASLGAYALLLGSSTTADKWRKMKKRIFGTLLGAIIGFGSYWLISIIFSFLTDHILQLLPVMVLLIIYISLAVSLIRVDYIYCVIFVTAMIVQIYSILHASVYTLVIDRVIENTLGALIGVVVAFVVFPVNSNKAVNKGLNILSVNLRKEILSLKEIWINKTYDEKLTQLARESENIKEGLNELSDIMVKTPWGKDSRSSMSKVISSINSLIYYMSNAVSHTVFVYELRKKMPKLTEEQVLALEETFKVLDAGAQLLGLEVTQRNKHIWPDYDKTLKILSKAFDNYSVLDSSISVTRSQPDNWHVEYFFAKDLSSVLKSMHNLHSKLLEN